jgi:hypothetical protein
VDKNFIILLYSPTLIALFSVMICISETGVLLISIAPLKDSQVTLDIDARHLAETQPHNDQKLQDWDTPNQEQINKLKI